jgi:hypothetical protein
MKLTTSTPNTAPLVQVPAIERRSAAPVAPDQPSTAGEMCGDHHRMRRASDQPSALALPGALAAAEPARPLSPRMVIIQADAPAKAANAPGPETDADPLALLFGALLDACPFLKVAVGLLTSLFAPKPAPEPEPAQAAPSGMVVIGAPPLD